MMGLYNSQVQKKKSLTFSVSIALLTIFIQCIFPYLAYASAYQTSNQPPQTQEDVTRAGVSVVRLLVSYIDPKGLATSTPVAECTGLGVIVASWKSQMAQNNWILTDGSLVSPDQTVCAPDHPAGKLAVVQIYASSTYKLQPIPLTISGTPTVLCDATPCSKGPALLSFSTDATDTRPFLDIATQDMTQEMGIALSQASSTTIDVPPTNATGMATFMQQVPNFLTPREISLTSSKLEAGTPIVNKVGQLTGLHLSGQSTPSAVDLQALVNQNITSRGPNPVHDNWDKGVDAYFQKDYSAAHTYFAATVAANPHFQSAKDFEGLTKDASAGNGSGQATMTPQAESPQGQDIYYVNGSPIPYHIIVIVFSLLVLITGMLVLASMLSVRKRKQRAQHQRFKADLAEAEHRAPLEAQPINRHGEVVNVRQYMPTESQRILPLQQSMPIKPQQALSVQQNAPSRNVEPQSMPLQQNIPSRNMESIIRPPAQPELQCPRCGKAVRKEAIYCPNCLLSLTPAETGLSQQGQSYLPLITPTYSTSEMPLSVPPHPLPVPKQSVNDRPATNLPPIEPAVPAPQKDERNAEKVHVTSRLGQRLGNYHLIRSLGHGGFADVYLGEHRFLKTQAAIKVLHTRLNNEAITDFLAEARTIASLIHPHIVRVLDFGVEGKESDPEQSEINIEGSMPFLVMDYAPGGTLRKRHPKGTRLPLATVITYIEQIAQALQYAHGKKLIHRDIKPENMLIGNNNEILLGDFGIAVVAHSEHSMSTQEMAGTVPYMAPEQIRGKPRPASDQYSLGIVVYEWLCGSRPFQGSQWEIIDQHISTFPTRLREKAPSIPASVEEVVLKALSKDPQQRFVSVETFANALVQAARNA